MAFQWADVHTEKLISIIAEQNILTVLDGKRQRNADVYTKVAADLNKFAQERNDNIQFTMAQVRAKFKALKQKYKLERTAQSKSGQCCCLT